jgi:hypothetical protein
MVGLDPAYLTTRTNREEVESRFDFSVESDFRADWKRLTDQMQAGDELWNFEPPPGLMRFWGVALVRAGKVISTLIEAVD